MKLLNETELVWSAVVANNNMNRKRKASGVNSYEKEIGFRPETFLEEYIANHGAVRWLDICCGEGNALIEAAEYLTVKALGDRALLKGIDLVDHFAPVSSYPIQFEMASATEGINGTYDLITCIHGLHYIGDKLNVLENIFSALSDNGLFTANFAVESIRSQDTSLQDYVKKILKDAGVTYSARRHMITCRGRKQVQFGLTYLGADDKAGPNYTGQEAVDSWYAF